MRTLVGLLVVLAVSIAACGGGSESPSPAPPTPERSQAPSPTAEPTATEVAAPEPTPAPSAMKYIVRAGDTLTAIAKRFNITLAALRAANPEVTNPRLLQIGQELVIPAP